MSICIRVQPKSADRCRPTPKAWTAFKKRVLAAGLGKIKTDDMVELDVADLQRLVGVGCVPRCQYICSVRLCNGYDTRCMQHVARTGRFRGGKISMSVEVSGVTVTTLLVYDLRLVTELIDAFGQHESRPWEILDDQEDPDHADAPTDNTAQSLA